MRIGVPSQTNLISYILLLLAKKLLNNKNFLNFYYPKLTSNWALVVFIYLPYYGMKKVEKQCILRSSIGFFFGRY